MKNLTITKWFVSLALVITLSVSSFAMGPGNKPAKPGNNNGKIKVEQKYHKKDVAQHKHHNKDVKIVKVYNAGPKSHKHHGPHHHHHNKVYYSCGDDFTAQCLGTGLCLIMMAAIAG